MKSRRARFCFVKIVFFSLGFVSLELLILSLSYIVLSLIVLVEKKYYELMIIIDYYGLESLLLQSFIMLEVEANISCIKR